MKLPSQGKSDSGNAFCRFGGLRFGSIDLLSAMVVRRVGGYVRRWTVILGLWLALVPAIGRAAVAQPDGTVSAIEANANRRAAQADAARRNERSLRERAERSADAARRAERAATAVARQNSAARQAAERDAAAARQQADSDQRAAEQEQKRANSLNDQATQLRQQAEQSRRDVLRANRDQADAEWWTWFAIVCAGVVVLILVAFGLWKIARIRRSRPDPVVGGLLLSPRRNLQLPGDKLPDAAGGVVVGRNPRFATAVINEEDVSRKHARFFYRDGSYWLEDTDSLGGTFVDGEQMKPGNPVPIQPGMEIRFADHAFRFDLAG